MDVTERKELEKRELDVIADRKMPAGKRQFTDIEEELLVGPSGDDEE